MSSRTSAASPSGIDSSESTTTINRAAPLIAS
jgi:hypothetical protein